MSARNLFVIKLKENINISCIYSNLNKFMDNNKFGIIFEPKNYYDEILDLLECKKNYFTITNNKNVIECEEIFEDYDAFQYASSFKKIEFKNKEKEFLYNKLTFIDELINIIFQHRSVKSIEIYISDQYSILLEDYSQPINVINHKFVDALLDSYNPTKKHNYYGVKTTKFIVNK